MLNYYYHENKIYNEPEREVYTNITECCNELNHLDMMYHEVFTDFFNLKKAVKDYLASPSDENKEKMQKMASIRDFNF